MEQPATKIDNVSIIYVAILRLKLKKESEMVYSIILAIFKSTLIFLLKIFHGVTTLGLLNYAFPCSSVFYSPSPDSSFS